MATHSDLTLTAFRNDRLDTLTRLQDLNRVLQWFETFNEPHVPQDVWFQCQSALAEGFTNAVRHAHRSRGPETPISLMVELGENYLKLCIWDWGQWFDMRAAIARLPQEVDCTAAGGRGLQIMDRVADTLSYECEADGRNCLTLLKWFETQPSPSVPGDSKA